MKKELAVIGGVPLVLDVPEEKTELEGGWRLKDRTSEGMLFDIRRFSRVTPIWVPIVIGTAVEEPLDVLWIGEGVVRALATHRGGCLQGYGDAVIELPAGTIERYKISVGTMVMIESETQTASSH
jgi:uncharacterized membrane protein (UPF0127 family)